MRPNDTGLGSYGWAERTGGRLSAAQRRSLLWSFVRLQGDNAFGRLSAQLHVNSGRDSHRQQFRLQPPTSALTRAAEEQALRRLSPALLNHSYRTFAFGAAIGALEGVRFDRELLLAAALLHVSGLPTFVRDVDFTVASARLACDVAEEVGLSSAATGAMRSAITMHLSPGVTPADGAVAYLLAAGNALDVIGLRSWQLPRDVLATVVQQHPRLDFKRVYSAAFRIEASRVPLGRAATLRRYGAFGLAIRLAPFRG